MTLAEDIQKALDIITKDPQAALDWFDERITNVRATLDQLERGRKMVAKIKGEPRRKREPKADKPAKGVNREDAPRSLSPEQLEAFVRERGQVTASEAAEHFGVHFITIGRMAAAMKSLRKTGSYYEVEE